MEGTNGATHEGIGGDDLAYVQVCEGEVLENIHRATWEPSGGHSSVTQCPEFACASAYSS